MRESESTTTTNDPQAGSGFDTGFLSEVSTGADDKPAPRSRTGVILAVTLAALTLFVAAVLGGGAWLAGKWEPHASPEESVEGFLDALLEARDAETAAGFTCASQSGSLNEALELLDALPDAAAAQFSWSSVTQIGNDGSTAVVTADVTLEATGDTDTWTFAVVTGDPDDTWRVCGFDMGE